MKCGKVDDRPAYLHQEVTRTNARLVGLRDTSLWLLIDLREALTARQEELQDQETEFWKVSHRAPNYYARTIALRTARKYARRMGQFPTLGTSRDSGEPSTSFARGLQEIFRILEIEAAIRGPAEWAIGQLTEDDINHQQGLLTGLLAGNLPVSAEKTATDSVVAALMSTKKGSSE